MPHRKFYRNCTPQPTCTATQLAPCPRARSAANSPWWGRSPPALRPHLFERGTRGDSGLPGHGLGLFIVQRVMALHGGLVDLRPNTPQGAIFRLWLPQDA